ncbi:restriction endonuclease [Paracoccus sediminis]|uniref:Restriction endonuclease n=1 Tax=Paracoccus sediminis TaxID=1214787 RepID=A0A238VKR1_9RHOB|nr:restriction endonuclease [Paracoccus sediminis]TBN52252.1 restriction endonuclease [Paracoccus sediminis]SNR34962.1 Restriction endonuclease [Paracoccus sediminis]
MRRLFSTAFYVFRYAVLSATLVVIGGFLMATVADGAMGGGRTRATAFAGIVAAGLLLPALLLRRGTGRRGNRRRARQSTRRRPAFLPKNGHAFEEWVAGRLEAQGWRAHVTAGSGDQGIDIIARRKGRKIGIQCKRYDGAVGNKAVQEAFSGRAYHRVDTAVVITTGHYTESAKALSRRTGVHLLHVRDIGRIDRLI